MRLYTIKKRALIDIGRCISYAELKKNAKYIIKDCDLELRKYKKAKKRL